MDPRQETHYFTSRILTLLQDERGGGDVPVILTKQSKRKIKLKCFSVKIILWLAERLKFLYTLALILLR